MANIDTTLRKQTVALVLTGLILTTLGSSSGCNGFQKQALTVGAADDSGKDEIRALIEQLITMRWSHKYHHGDFISFAFIGMHCNLNLDFRTDDRGWFDPRVAESWKGNEEVFQKLLLSLKHRDPRVRGLGARALGYVGDRRAVESLAEAYPRDEDVRTRLMCVISLGMLGGLESVGPLGEALEASNEWVRYQAVHSLDWVHSEDALKALQQAKNSKYPEVREEVGEVLKGWKFGGPNPTGWW